MKDISGVIVWPWYYCHLRLDVSSSQDAEEPDKNEKT